MVYHNIARQLIASLFIRGQIHITKGMAVMMDEPRDDSGLRVDRSTKTLRERTVERLREAILDFHFKPGERLIERSLCEKLGVSRTVVRETLRHLEAEGFVESLTQQGPAVAQPDVNQAAQVYEIRAVLEAEAARAAAQVAGPSDTAKLTDANAAIQAAFAHGTARDVLKATTNFYELLFAIAGKSVAWQLVQGLNARINYLRAITIAGPNRAADVNTEMTRIIEAIGRNDGKDAAKASFDHVEKVRKLAMAALKRGTRDPVGSGPKQDTGQ